MPIVKHVDAIRQFPTNENGDLMNPTFGECLFTGGEMPNIFEKLDRRRIVFDGVADLFQ